MSGLWINCLNTTKSVDFDLCPFGWDKILPTLILIICLAFSNAESATESSALGTEKLNSFSAALISFLDGSLSKLSELNSSSVTSTSVSSIAWWFWCL